MESEATVFIVVDDEEIRASLRRLLEQVDLRVEEYGNAAAFLEAYDPTRHGCLLLDVRMPGMSGAELQKRMLEMDMSLPTIFINHGRP